MNFFRIASIRAPLSGLLGSEEVRPGADRAFFLSLSRSTPQVEASKGEGGRTTARCCAGMSVSSHRLQILQRCRVSFAKP